MTYGTLEARPGAGIERHMMRRGRNEQDGAPERGSAAWCRAASEPTAHWHTLWLVAVGFALVIYTMVGWWNDVIKEAKAGDHTPVVSIGLRYGMIMFIASEVMFFVAWFWIFFEMALFHGHRATAVTGQTDTTPETRHQHRLPATHRLRRYAAKITRVLADLIDDPGSSMIVHAAPERVVLCCAAGGVSLGAADDGWMGSLFTRRARRADGLVR